LTKGGTLAENTIVEQLKKRKEELEQTPVGKELADITEVLRRLSDENVIVGDRHTPVPTSKEYEGLGIVLAAKKWLKEVGGEHSTRDIVEGIKARGWTTKSEKPVATVYST